MLLACHSAKKSEALGGGLLSEEALLKRCLDTAPHGRRGEGDQAGVVPRGVDAGPVALIYAG